MMARGGVFEVWTWMVSFGFLAMLQQFVPPEFIDRFRYYIRAWVQRLTPYTFCDVHEWANSHQNSLYPDVEIYLASLQMQEAHRVNLYKRKTAKSMTVAPAKNQPIFDTFDGAHLQWVRKVQVIERNRQVYRGFPESSDEKRSFTLQLNKKDKARMLVAYMEHIEVTAKELRHEDRDLLLYTNVRGSNHTFYSSSSKRYWDSVAFKHPAQFEKLALDGDLRSKIETDLDNFVANKKFYRRVGKAWKRGYLLFGPPGTGKSSMIAAIANKLRYDVYDLELTEVDSNSDLRKLLLNTTDRSIIVIEDIDCSLDLSGQRKDKKQKKKERKDKKQKEEEDTPPPPGAPENPKEQSKVTLSGLLNFVDGLWSCCGSERIFVFTTNHADKVDPALLRAGRMDMHIHLGYCTFMAFKVLAKTYLEITEHELFDKVERAFKDTFMTPAEVTELLIRNQGVDVEVVLENLMLALQDRHEDPRLKNSDNMEELQEEKAVEISEKKEITSTPGKRMPEDDASTVEEKGMGEPVSRSEEEKNLTQQQKEECSPVERLK